MLATLTTYILTYAVTIFIILYFYFTRHFDYWKKRNVPFVKPIPFVGNFWNGFTMRQSVGQIFDDLYRRSKAPFLGFFILDKPCLLIRDPQLVKKILSTDFKYFDDRNGASNKTGDPMAAYGLLMLKNPEWKTVRTKMTPAFSSGKIRMMYPLFNKVGTDFVRYLEEKTRNNAIVEVKDLCQRFTVEVVSCTVYGINVDCFTEEKSEILNMSQQIFDWINIWSALQMRIYFVAPILVNWLNLKLVKPKCSKYFRNLFIKVMEDRVASNTSRNDFIDLLIQLEKEDSDFLKGDVLIAQAAQFFGAGFETTSGVMAFALYEIAQNQSIHAILTNEIETISRKHGGISYEALQEMEYLEQCIKESLRKYPILPFLDRKCKLDYKVPDSELVIEKGTALFISTLSLHNDPHFFPNPEIFNPERFSKKSSLVDNFAYLPFGEGPRHCIGQRFGMLNAKCGLAHILANFMVTACDETNLIFEKNGLLISPLNGIKLKFSKIKNN